MYFIRSIVHCLIISSQKYVYSSRLFLSELNAGVVNRSIHYTRTSLAQKKYKIAMK